MKDKNKVNIDDGFNSMLVETARFDGILEIPIIEKPKEFIIPNSLIPFSQMNRTKDYSEFVMFYEYDNKFAEFIRKPEKFIKKIRKFKGIISPDNSLYRDMPLVLQMLNVYRSRAIGHYFQEQGIYVIPNVRWGDERSYKNYFGIEEKFAFLGVPKDSIVSIGTYGCIQGKENRFYFKEGLKAMLEELSPKIVLVYGNMPDSIFCDFKKWTKFINYQNWISLKKGGVSNGNR